MTICVHFKEDNNMIRVLTVIFMATGDHVNLDHAYIWNDVRIASNVVISQSVVCDSAEVKEGVTLNNQCVLAYNVRQAGVLPVHAPVLPLLSPPTCHLFIYQIASSCIFTFKSKCSGNASNLTVFTVSLTLLWNWFIPLIIQLHSLSSLQLIL